MSDTGTSKPSSPQISEAEPIHEVQNDVNGSSAQPVHEIQNDVNGSSAQISSSEELNDISTHDIVPTSEGVPNSVSTCDLGMDELSAYVKNLELVASAMEEVDKECDSDSTSAPQTETDHSPQNQKHHLKWIQWYGKKTAIVTQNENGPCPLIAIANILLLRGKIKLPTTIKSVTAADLLDYIGDSIMENVPKDLPGVSVLNYEQNMHDAIAILPHLHTGLDVNVKFTGVRHFEYTPECIIFDLLNIPLYHGWLVDPQSYETVAALGSLGYNQLVERIIVYKCSSNINLVTEALIAEEFLERTASQLTYHGLCELNSTMKHEELAVLFRNNHFSTILKKRVCVCTEDAESQLMAKEELNELFQLVTDQGFLHEPLVVWETLCSIDGDGQFVDGYFASVPPKSNEVYLPERLVSEEQQINHDYLVALSLQEDQKKEQDKEQAWDAFKQTVPGEQDTVSDEELARRLQEDEDRLARAAPAQAQDGGGGARPSQVNAQLTGDRNKKGIRNTTMNKLGQTFWKHLAEK